MPLAYTIETTLAPTDGAETARAAFARLTEATGISFMEAGPGARAEVVIAWVDSPDGALLGGDPSRWGWTTARWDATSDRLVAALIHLNARAQLPTGMQDRQSWGGVLMHELGHVVGLGHSDDLGEIMYPRVVPGPAAWGPTDLVQLRNAGVHLGCALPTDSPRRA